MYPGGTAAHTLISVPALADKLCGRSRPGHFDGVATVVSKLFNIIQPDSAFFGLKDYQQFLVISRLVLDLQFPLRLVGVDTVREDSGLAMSSRNNYLSGEQKQQAASLYRCLQSVVNEVQQGREDWGALENAAEALLRENGLRPDYVAVCAAGTLEPATAEDTDLVVLAAAYLGTTRLIDNIRFTRRTAP